MSTQDKCPVAFAHGNPFRYCPSCDWIEPSPPRTWSLPPQPGPEVTALRCECHGIWERDDLGEQWVWAGGDDFAEYMVKAFADWADFLVECGPLTDATPTGEDRADA